MTDYADLIANARHIADYSVAQDPRGALRRCADAIEALARDNAAMTAMCDSYADENQRLHDRAEKAEAILALQGVGIGAIESEQAAARELARQLINAERERDEARAALRKVQARTYSTDRQCALKADAVAEICDIVSAALSNKGGCDE